MSYMYKELMWQMHLPLLDQFYAGLCRVHYTSSFQKKLLIKFKIVVKTVVIYINFTFILLSLFKRIKVDIKI